MKLKDLLKEVAPTIAGVIGAAVGGSLGPLAAVGVKMLGEKLLGKPDASLAEVEDAVRSATPEQLIELRRMDRDFEARALELGFRREELEVADRDSARQRDVAFLKAGRRNDRADILAYAAVGSLILIVLLVFIFEIDQTTKELLLFLAGVLSKIAGDVYSFEFGSSRGEQAKSNKMTEWLDQGEGK